VCEVNFDPKSNCITLTGQIDDARRAETDVRRKCLAAVCHDTVRVSRPGIMNASFLILERSPVIWATNQLGDSQLGDTPTKRQPTGRHESVNWATVSQIYFILLFVCLLLYKFKINIKPKSTAHDSVSEIWI